MIDLSALQARRGVYVLCLHGDNYYVGYASNVRQRVRSQMDGPPAYRASWVQAHPPLGVHQVLYDHEEADAKVVVLNFMRQVGWEKVRGGPYTRVTMTKPPAEFLDGVTCFCCMSDSHSLGDCPSWTRRDATERHEGVEEEAVDGDPAPEASHQPVDEPKRSKCSTYFWNCFEALLCIAVCFGIYHHTVVELGIPAVQVVCLLVLLGAFALLL